jgi:methylamine dehydrogenase accessory protein MauD
MQILGTISYILLWLVVILEGIFILALARQIGILHGRIGSAGARTINAGPKIGEPAPILDIKDINDQKVVSGSKYGLLTLLLFVSPGCVVDPRIWTLPLRECFKTRFHMSF